MAKLMQIVVFGIGAEEYGVGIDTVHEIIRVPEITAVPAAPDFLLGMINLRGRILPVIDLRKRLRIPDATRNKQTRVLIVEEAGRRIGLLVDFVSEVIKFNPDDVEGTPDIVAAIGIGYITGMVKIQSRLVSLLDFGKILSVAEIRKSITAADVGSAAAAA